MKAEQEERELRTVIAENLINYYKEKGLLQEWIDSKINLFYARVSLYVFKGDIEV